MKVLSIVAIIIACLVSACSSSQQQSSRDRGDEQVSMALPNEQPGSDVNSTDGPQNAAVGVVRDKTLTGTSVKWTRIVGPQG
jgi:uncharacterized lipoprotein